MCEIIIDSQEVAKIVTNITQLFTMCIIKTRKLIGLIQLTRLQTLVKFHNFCIPSFKKKSLCVIL